MNDAASATIAALTGQGHTVWLVGASARDFVSRSGTVLASDVRRQRVVERRVELVTDAPADTLAGLREGPLAGSDVVRVSSLDEASIADWLARRGVTLDAFAVHATSHEIIDPFDGVAHLAAGLLRTVVAPDQAFREDPILLLRIPRLLSATGAAAPGDVRRLANRDAGNLLDIRHRRPEWADELNGLLLGDFVERALQLLFDTRVLAILMPEVAAMVGFDKSCTVHHKDIWEHTKLVTQKAQADLVVRWTALCHDIGKVWTRSVNREGKVHFFRHEEHGSLLFEGIAHRVGLDPVLTERVVYVIENHSRVNLYRDDWSDSAVRRLIRETAGHLPDLVAFSKADFTTKREAKIAELKRQMADLEERLLRVAEQDARVPPLSKGIGTAIMTRFGLAPSRAVGELKSLLEAEIDAGRLPARADDALYLDWLAEADVARRLLAAG